MYNTYNWHHEETIQPNLLQTISSFHILIEFALRGHFSWCSIWGCLNWLDMNEIMHDSDTHMLSWHAHMSAVHCSPFTIHLTISLKGWSGPHRKQKGFLKMATIQSDNNKIKSLKWIIFQKKQLVRGLVSMTSACWTPLDSASCTFTLQTMH